MKWILGVAYNGSNYVGWQRQRDLLSVQECLECAISTVADEEVKVFCASRTDSGVHATCQVVHFFTVRAWRSNFSWIAGINRNLPIDIVVHWIIETAALDFHARFSVVWRRYRYIIYNNFVRSPFLNKRVTCYKKFLNIEKMINASRCLLGEKDFTSFRSLQCQSSSSFRNLYDLSIVRYGDYVIIDMQANSFVHKMVRNIVGSLVEVGWGRHSEAWISELLLKRNRCLASDIAPPDGLYLTEIRYPSHYCIPRVSDSFRWLIV